MSGNGRIGGGGARGNGAGPRASSPATTAAAGTVSIPAGSRKIVQNLKEIVNYPEHEIYAMLKECNMDPSETVNRLLNQDTFQEVKSKRDKKKEVKDTSEFKVRGGSSTTNRGGRAGSDRGLRVVPSNSSSNDYSVSRSRPLPKKDNTPTVIPSSSILGPGSSGSLFNRPAGSISTPPTDTPVHVPSATDGTSLSSKPSIGFQPAWSGVPGQVSMADIVRMGRPQTKFSSKPAAAAEMSHSLYNSESNFQLGAKHAPSTVPPSDSSQEWQSFPVPFAKDSEVIHDSVATTTDQHVLLDGQSLINKLPSENWSSMFATSNTSATLVEPSAASSLCDDRVKFSLGSYADEIHGANLNVDGETVMSDSIRSTTPYDGQRQLTEPGGGTSLDVASFNNLSSYHSEKHIFEDHEVEDDNSEVSSVAANLQQLSIQQEDLDRKPADSNPAVIFPNYLQVTNADCSHLSFGSFGSGKSTNFPGSFVHNNLKNDLETGPTTSEISSFEQLDSRNSGFYNDEPSKSTTDENAVPSASTMAENHGQSPPPQPTIVETDTSHTEHELHYNLQSVMPGHAFSSTTQPSSAEHNYADAQSQVQNLASLSSMMNLVQQAYANSLQSNLLPSAAQPRQEFDSPYLPLLANQSMPTKYSTVMSSTSEPALSMPETVKPNFFSIPQSTSQSLEGSNSIPSGPTLPQHLAVNPYSQPTLPLGHFASMVGYPFLPSYAYMPSAFQQAYTSNSAYHQSPATAQSAGVKYTLAQYKNSPLGNLPQSANLPSGYGGFGSSTNIPGNFVLNPPNAPTNSTTGLDDTFASQYKEASSYASLQQSENSNMWVQGAGSRTVSALPANTYYSLQGQSQHGGFRQAQQQQPSNYGALGYPNFYRSQVGMEHQQSTSEVANLSGSQGLPSQASHHIWQRNY